MFTLDGIGGGNFNESESGFWHLGCRMYLYSNCMNELKKPDWALLYTGFVFKYTCSET